MGVGTVGEVSHDTLADCADEPIAVQAEDSH